MRVDVIAVGLAVTRIGHVQHFSVRCAYKAVRLDQIVDNAHDRLAVGSNVVNVFTILIQDWVSPVGRVSEIHATPRVDPQIVGLIETFAVELVCEHSYFAFRAY